MKPKRMRLVLVLLLVLTVVGGSVAALMFRQTNELTEAFEIAYVDCVVSETLSNQKDSKTAITVKNTGNIDAYIRVRLVTYWAQKADDGSLQIVGRSPAPSMDVQFIEGKYVERAEGWIKESDNTFYYNKAIAPNASTGNLLSQALPLQTEDGYLQVIEVFAEAIQSEPTQAITDSWQVQITDDGWIVP